ncbi:MAG TPA: phenylalanine--tRNA ligase subunit beta [bacterium]|nr:phenylalanine--tRNA ligase subunit beta [bacterium]HPT29535.1 phenylalanine--tRNA ligase subunit beta [bacterium]
MLLSINWLQEFLSLKGITPETIASELTLHTVEVEKIERPGDRFKNVVVGQVLSVEKHPNADRLQITTVNVGAETLRIVCGAPNVAVGQLVPVALVGAILPNGLEIKEAEVRGEKSSGMICAADELGLGQDHSGIMVLEKAKIGQNFADYLKSDDVILEVDNKSLSHRSDLWGHYGLARELSALLDIKLKPYSRTSELTPENNPAETLNIKVEDAKLCPRYLAIKLEGIEVAESPKWLKDRLMAVGQKPINNIVDAANYIMLELGQPLHTFDAKNIKKIVVRCAKKNEELLCLDGQERKLNSDTLLITDGKDPIAIAGIIGGQNSAINPETTAIIIESANFQASSIRKSSQNLALRTEASMRFEKSLDPQLTDLALKAVVSLIKELVPSAKISSELNIQSTPLPETKTIVMPWAWLRNLMGVEMEKKEIKKILNHLGFEISEESKEALTVIVPSWRAAKDVAIKEDIAEEIMRIYGYNNFPGELPESKMALPEDNLARALEWQIKDALSLDAKLFEVYNYSFVNETDLEKANLNTQGYLRLANPISQQHTLLRQNLVVNLLGNIKTNQYKYDEIGIFEIGSIFQDLPGDFYETKNKEERLPYQEKKLGIMLAGNNAGELFAKLKSIITRLIGHISQDQWEVIFVPTDLTPGYADSKMRAIIKVDHKELGLIAKIADLVQKNNGLKKMVVCAELSLNQILKLKESTAAKTYRENSKYPPVVRDLAFVVSQKILYNDLYQEIKNFNSLIANVELFDVYEGTNLAAGQKSLAFHVNYQDQTRTLTSEEIDTLQAELIKRLQDKFEAVLRDF